MEDNKAKKKKRSFQLNSPSCFKDDYKIYTDALNEVIDKPGVKNIGIVAPYGSGKSSMLETFFSEYPARRSQRTCVSLATFNNTKKIDDINCVEKSILEQIIFKRKYSWLSKSNINLRRSKFLFPLLTALLSTIFATLLLICLMMYTHSDIPFLPLREHFWFYFGAGMLFGSATLFFLIHSIKLNKITIQNIELSFDEQKNGSVLNQFIDEIIIYCSETNKKYFVFEDIDRFDCVELLAKLREINTLINDNSNVSEKVVFIYCVRDDIFKEPEDRAKFFDFVVSLTPVLNPRNSRVFIENAIKTNNDEELGITEIAMKEMSQFIKEKRILNNVINDYIFYRDKLENIETIENDKLFAMMIYKNLNLADFSKLQSNKGILYDFFNRYKTDAFVCASEEIKKQIDFVKNEIENSSVKNFNDSLKQLKEKIRGIIALNGTPSPNPLSNYLLCDTVDSFHNDSSGYYVVINSGFINPYTGRFQLSTIYKNLSVDELANTLDGKTPLELEEELIALTKDRLEQQSLDLRNKYNSIKQLKAHELLSKGYYRPAVVDEIKKDDFLYFAIKNNYIDESYFVYSGKGDNELDNEYIKAVLNGDEIDPNKTIQNPTVVISTLMPNRFSTPSILNYSILDTLLGEKQAVFDEKREALMDYLTQRNIQTIGFISNYVFVGKKVPELIAELHKHRYSDLIGDVAEYSGVDSQSINSLVGAIIAHKNSKVLTPFFNQNGELRTIIERSEHPIEAYFTKFESLDDYIGFLASLGEIKLEHIDDFRNIRNEAMFHIFKRIIDRNMFAINAYNMTIIGVAYLHKKDINLSSFLNSKNESLKNYCMSDLQSCMSSILDISGQMIEEEKTIETVLKSKEISDEVKRVYLARISNTIDYIEGLEPELYSLMLTSNLLKPSFKSLSSIRKMGVAIGIVVDFVKSHILSFTDKLEDVDLFKEIVNDKSISIKETEKVSEYLPGKINFTIINDDEKRSLIIRKAFADVDEQSFLTCAGMIESIVSCINISLECLDKLPSVISRYEDYFELLNHQYLRNAVKRLIISKYYNRFINHMDEPAITSLVAIVCGSYSNEKYDLTLLLILFKASKTNNQVTKLIEICGNCLTDKELALAIKEVDTNLFKKLSSKQDVISIDLTTADNNQFFALLEKRKIIRSYNRRKNRCNVKVEKFYSLIS